MAEVLRSTRRATTSKSVAAAFLAGGGEMGRRMRALDWARTPLGTTEQWPVSLRTAVRILLTSRQPMMLFWGERFAALYNDAAKGMVSAKHPQVLGQAAAQAWPDLWDALGDELQRARGQREAIYLDSAELPVDSAGARADARFAISLSPVPDDGGGAGGVLCVLNETESFHEAIMSLSSELDVQALVQKVTDVATRITKARFGAFFYNAKAEEGGAYQLFTLSGADRESFAKLGMPRATPIFAPTFAGGAPIRIDDVTKDPRYGQMGPHHGMPKGHLPVRSYLAVPVHSRTGEVLGALFFAHPEPAMFDERAERNARAIAAHAGVAIDNANLFGIARGEIEERSRVEIALRDSERHLALTRDELAAQIHALTRLHELATQLPALGDLQAALHMILDTAVALQGGDFGSINLYHADQDALVLAATVGFDDAAIERVRFVRPGQGNGSCGTCYHLQSRVTIVDTETDPTFESLRDFARQVGFRAVHSTPISTRSGAALGVLSVHFREPRLPTQREVQLVEVCARHAVDAIEHHRVRTALEESERLYRAIGESINYGVWVCDEHGRSQYVSESFLRLTGLTSENYADEIWSRILQPEEAERVREQWKACVASGRDWETQVQVKTADGGYRAILSRGVAIRDADNRITGWAGMNLDIDRLKRVENELRELDQRKNEFLATLAHELRNPLAPIRNGLEIMRLGRGNPGMVEQARTMMERQMHQMIRLVDDLLDVSRVSRGKIELRRERIDLLAAVTNAIETAKPLIDQNGQTLVVDLPPGPVTVHADLTRLSQVFANVLNNAAKYTDRGGRIEVSMKPTAHAVEVRIRDDGIGIPPSMLERIFGIFTQVERSLEKARGGLGIGLSIARRLVEMHGGTITAQSDGPGTGSEFKVVLPTAEARTEPKAEDANAPSPSGMLRRRVLIADDNTDAASSLSLVLEMMGNDVRVAHDGLEALAVAESFRPDAVLLDIGMPGLNGYEVCRKLRERPATAKAMIVALTGWGQEEDRRKSREFGFDHHLVKPVEPRALEALLARPAREAG